MEKSREQRIAEASEVTDAELAHLAAIMAKHGLEENAKNGRAIMGVQVFLMGVGFGRNAYTAKILRVVADLVESPEIETAEEIEARVDGKSH